MPRSAAAGNVDGCHQRGGTTPYAGDVWGKADDLQGQCAPFQQRLCRIVDGTGGGCGRVFAGSYAQFDGECEDTRCGAEHRSAQPDLPVFESDQDIWRFAVWQFWERGQPVVRRHRQSSCDMDDGKAWCGSRRRLFP